VGVRESGTDPGTGAEGRGAEKARSVNQGLYPVYALVREGDYVAWPMNVRRCPIDLPDTRG
jgi:hypothetical protein